MKWLSQNYPQVAELALSHLLISLPAILASLLIAVPVGWASHRIRPLRGPVVALASGIYAVPSLPLLVLVPVALGTSLRSSTNLVVVLTLYGAAILIRSTTDAFATVPDDARTSATAMGYTRWSMFWGVELPLAGPVILVGLRIVAVSTISLTTIGAVTGIESLGTLFTDGFQRGIASEVTAGIVGTGLLALGLDAVCLGAGRILMPWTSSSPLRRHRTEFAR